MLIGFIPAYWHTVEQCYNSVVTFLLYGKVLWPDPVISIRNDKIQKYVRGWKSTDRQKAVWFNNDFRVSCASFITGLLTVNFFLVKFGKNLANGTASKVKFSNWIWTLMKSSERTGVKEYWMHSVQVKWTRFLVLLYLNVRRTYHVVLESFFEVILS